MNKPELKEIIDYYQQTVDLNPNDAKAHHHLAMYYSQQDNYSKARQHFEAALLTEPNFVDAHYHFGLLLLRNNEWAKAEGQFLEVLSLNSQHISAHFYIGVLLLQLERLDQAEQHFQFILGIKPDHVQTLINFGALELKRDAGQLAIAYFTQVLILDENNLDARRNLAATFMHYDRFENALTHYVELEKNNQLEIEDLYNMGVAAAALGQLPLAISYYQQVIAYNNKHSAALNNLAAIYIRLGERSEAKDFLELALQASPDDTASRFMLDVLMDRKQNPATSHDYVRHLFNNYALYYEQHLQNILQYNLPQQGLDILRALKFDSFQHVLDLGCGTGLSGVVLRDCSAQLTGVDLSQKMLAHARHKNVYDRLIESDIVSFLWSDAQCYDLIQVLDVLPYFGELNELFAALIPRLSKYGIIVLSAEISDEQPWQIQDSMRFCHNPDYIHEVLLSHSMRLLHRSRVIARQENEQNLYAMLMVYQI